MRIAIVEDNAKDRAALMEYLDQYMQSRQEQFHILLFPDGLDFISDYTADFDIIFMDIDMPHLNGLDAARRLRQVDEDAVLIFITNLAQYAIKGYEVHALDFMVKPVAYGEIEYKLDRTLRYCRKYGDTALTLDVGGTIRKIPIRSIYYVEVYNHSLVYHTTAGTITSHGQLKELEADPCFSNFSKCNSCYLVNCSQVTEVHSSYVVAGGDKLTISRRRKKLFMQQLAQHLGGEL